MIFENLLEKASIRPRLVAAALALIALAGCGEDAVEFSAPDRQPGVRAPRTAPCDPMDPLRCLLPWPSSVFSAADATSPTGIRVAVQGAFSPDDDPASINRADGFSRVTPLVAGFDTPLDPPAEGAVILVLAQPDHPAYGEAVPLRVEARGSVIIERESMVFGYPLRALEPGADYVAVVTDALRAAGGGALSASRAALVALGREEPASQEEADLAGYHAPTRAVLERAGIDPERVLRVWDFTTRSAEDATRRLTAMRDGARAAVLAGEATVTIDTVDVPAGGAVAAIVEGRLGGLPAYAGDAGLTLDDGGLPLANGTREAPFRAVLPAGAGDYRFVMFGHGLGGSYHDDAFDQDLAGAGLGKVGIQFYGWTDADVVDTFVTLLQMFEGTERSSAFLMQAIADGAAIETAMAGPLGDALSAPTLGGAANPAAGRRPDDTLPLWAGGSLGGTMGLVYAGAHPELSAAVLNVPGAGWTHFIPGSNIYATLEGLLRGAYGGDLDLALALAAGQGNWDDIDGATWIEPLRAQAPVLLIQESMGDPVLPNPGSANVAVTADALFVGAVLEPIEGLEAADAAVGRSGITQYLVPGTDANEIHGFAARDTPAGAAARDQIQAFLQSVIAGAPRIDVPAACPNKRCDFTGP